MLIYDGFSKKCRIIFKKAFLLFEVLKLLSMCVSLSIVSLSILRVNCKYFDTLFIKGATK